MSIQPSQGEGQPTTLPISPQTQAKRDYYTRLILRDNMRRYHLAVPLPEEAEAKIRAYWHDLFRHEIAAMEAEWAEPRVPSTIIQHDTNGMEAGNGNQTTDAA